MTSDSNRKEHNENVLRRRERRQHRIESVSEDTEHVEDNTSTQDESQQTNMLRQPQHFSQEQVGSLQMILKNSESVIRRLEEEKNVLESNLNIIKSEVIVLREQNQVLERERGSLQENRNRQTLELQELKIKASEQGVRIQQYEQKQSELQVMVEQKENEANKVKEKNQELIVLAERRRDLEIKLDDANAKLKWMEQELTKKEEQNEHLMTRHEKILEQQLEEGKRIQSDHFTEISRFQSNQETQQRSIEFMQKQIQEQNDAVIELVRANAILEEEKQQITLVNKNQERDLTQANTSLQDQQRKVQEQKDTIKSLMTNLQEAKQSEATTLKEHEAEQFRLSNELTMQHKKLMEIEQENRLLEQAQETLENEIQQQEDLALRLNAALVGDGHNHQAPAEQRIGSHKYSPKDAMTKVIESVRRVLIDLEAKDGEIALLMDQNKYLGVKKDALEKQMARNQKIALEEIANRLEASDKKHKRLTSKLESKAEEIAALKVEKAELLKKQKSMVDELASDEESRLKIETLSTELELEREKLSTIKEENRKLLQEQKLLTEKVEEKEQEANLTSLEDLQQANHALVQELSSTKAELSAVLEENHSMARGHERDNDASNIEDLKEKCKTSSQDVKRLSTLLEEKGVLLENQQATVTSLREETTNLQLLLKQESSNRERIEDLTRELESKGAEIIQIQELNERLVAEQETLKRVENGDPEFTTSQNPMALSNEAESFLRDALGIKEAELIRARLENKRLLKQLESQGKTSEESKRLMNETEVNDDYEMKIVTLTQELESKNSECAQMKTENGWLLHGLKETEEALERQKQIVAKLDGTDEEIIHDLVDKEREINELKEANQKLLQSKETMGKEIQEHKAIVLKLISELEDESKHEFAALEELSERNEDLVNQLDEIEKEVEMTREENQRLLKLISGMDAESSHHDSEGKLATLDESDERIELLESQLEEKDKTIEKLKAQLENVSSHELVLLKKSNQVNESLAAQLKEKEDELNALKELVVSERSLSSTSGKNDSLSSLLTLGSEKTLSQKDIEEGHERERELREEKKKLERILRTRLRHFSNKSLSSDS